MHVVGTAGHVDHGKSTLVLALTGMDPDRFEEEKRRGLTIDLGFAWCTLPSGRQVGIVDVPGHERFIRNMLAGVGSIDAALFVVAADEGWMPQSTEHLNILDLLGVRRGVVALTKTDLGDDDLALAAADEITDRLAGTTLEGSEIVPVSAVTGAGLDRLAGALDDVLEAAGAAQDRGRPRLWVDRSFSIAGAGTVVTGTLTGGALRVGQEARILPDGRRARIRSLQTHKTTVDEAVAGSRVAVNLVGLERAAVHRGDVLVTGDWISTDRFAARVRALRDLAHPLRERGALELFCGSALTPCRIRFLEDARELAPGTAALAEVYLEGKLPLVPGDRFVVRDVGRWETAAGGIVVDQVPSKLRRGDEQTLARLRSRESLGGPSRVAWTIADRGIVSRTELEALSGVGGSELEEGIAAGAERIVGEHVVAKGHLASLGEVVRGELRRYHDAHPLAAGMPAEELRGAVDADPRAWPLLADALEADAVLVREGATVRLPEHGVSFDGAQRAAADRAVEALRTGGASPPELAEIGLPLDVARALERLGELVLVTSEIAYPAATWQDIETAVVRLIEERGPVTVSDVRGAMGTTRKYAVPLLEKLDATNVTRRKGDVRELGSRGRELAEKLRSARA